MVLTNARLNHLIIVISIYLILLVTQSSEAELIDGRRSIQHDDSATIRRQSSIGDVSKVSGSRNLYNSNIAEPSDLFIENSNCNGKSKQQQSKCENGKVATSNYENVENFSEVPPTSPRKSRNLIRVDNETYVITANDNSTAGYILGEIQNSDLLINSGSLDPNSSNQLAHNYTLYLVSKNPNHIAIALDFEQIDLEIRNGCEFQKIEFSLPDITEPKTATSADDATTSNGNQDALTSTNDDNNNNSENTMNATECDSSESKYVTFPLFMRDLWLIFGSTLDKTITNTSGDNDFRLANLLVDSIRDSTCQELRLKRNNGNSSDLVIARSSKQFVRQSKRPKGRRNHKRPSRRRQQQQQAADALQCDEDSFEYRQLAHKRLSEELNWPHLLEICGPVNRLLVPLRALKIRIRSDEFAKNGTFKIRYQFIEDPDEIDFKSNGQFLCRNRKLIALELKCNGFDDCGDASDEPTLVCQELNGSVKERENALKSRDASIEANRNKSSARTKRVGLRSFNSTHSSGDDKDLMESRRLRFFDKSLLHCCNSKTAWAPLIPHKENSKPINLKRLKRIVNGSPVNLGDWPAQVSLQTDFAEPFSHWCGGVLIHPEYVLTAAHCITSDYVPYQIKVVFGQVDLMKIDQNTTQVRYVDDLIVYPGLSWIKLRQLEKWKNDEKNDFAILKLAAPVLLNQNVLPACLPPINKAPEIGADCMITGWGRTLGSGNQSMLKKIAQKVVEPSECIGELSGMTRFNDNTMLCIRNQPPSQRSGICEGDSGGPLYCERNNNDNRSKNGSDIRSNHDIDDKTCQEVAGLVSSSIELEALASMCAVGGPLNVYADTARKGSWIMAIMDMLEALQLRGETS